MSRSVDASAYVRIVGADHVSTVSPWRSAADNTWHAPALVVRPQTTREVVQLVQQASRDGLPIVPAGGGTGYAGGVTTPTGGIMVDMRRMAEIVNVDAKQRLIRVQPGITIQELNDRLRSMGLWWPHDPGSRAMSTVGGVISVRGIGTFHTRYGWALDMVYGVTIVPPSGEVITLGARPKGRATGYNVLQMLLAAEGTLGVITEVVLKVWPLPQYRECRVIAFPSLGQVEGYVGALLESGLSPETLLVESQDRFVNEFEFQVSTPERLDRSVGNARWCVIISMAGHEAPSRWQASHAISLAMGFGGRDVEDAGVVRDYWSRKTEKLTTDRTTIPDYHVVDVALPGLDMRSIEEAYATSVPMFGVKPKGIRFYVSWPSGEVTTSAQILYEENSVDGTERALGWTRAMSQMVAERGGTLSGILGVGVRLVDDLGGERSEAELRLMRTLKVALDPANLMNPGKLLPREK